MRDQRSPTWSVSFLLGLLLLAAGSASGCLTANRRAKGALVPFQLAKSGAATSARKHALLVGIGTFDDPAWQPLRWATKDAEDMALSLEGFSSVRTLTRREETTRAGILAAIQEFKKQLTSPNDTLVVYFSSHGSLDRKPGGAVSRFIVTSDTVKSLVHDTGLAVETLLQNLSTIPSRRKAVLFAFCHSGKGKSGLSDELQEALAHLKGGFFVKPLDEVSEATVVASASAFGETAAEDDKLQNDIYTHFLVQALAEGNDSNGDGAVTVTEAHEFAREKTYYFTGGAQRPSIELQMDGVDPVVLRGSRQRAGKPIVFSYAPSAAGLALYVNGAKKGDLPGTVVTETGPQLVGLVDRATGESIYVGKVDLTAGEAIDVSKLIPPPMTIDGGAGVGIFGFFDEGFSSSVAPATPTVSATCVVRNVLLKGLEVRFAFDYLHTTGSIVVDSATVSFKTDAASLRIGPGSSFRKGRLRFSGHLLGGLFYLNRTLAYNPTDFNRQEDAFNFSLSLDVSIGFNPWGPIWISLGGGPGLLFSEFDRSPHTAPFGGIALLITVGS